MQKAGNGFQRWLPLAATTWSLQIFERYNDELGVICTAHVGALKYTYSTLKRDGANWEAEARQSLASDHKYLDHFDNLKHWSDAYNQFDNWVNLSWALTTSSNLETYIAGVVRLALESDPGAILGAPQTVDGATLIKRGCRKLDTTEHVKVCTMGDWSARLSALERLFGPLPPSINARHAELEALRGIRNRFGHAFGRDIEAAREHGRREVHPIEKITRERAYKLQTLCAHTARELDRHLLTNHIGNFEPVRFYSSHLPQNPSAPVGERARTLRKALGEIGGHRHGSIFCRGLIRYWDAL